MHRDLTSSKEKRNKKKKIKLVELTEDDPIFKSGFIISSPTIRIRKIKNTRVKGNEEKNKKKAG